MTASKTRVAVAGKFLVRVKLPNTSVSTTSASRDTYVFKFDSAGKDLWSRHFSGSTIWAKAYGHAYTTTPGRVSPQTIATTPNGRIVAAGGFARTVDFGKGEMTNAAGSTFLAEFLQ